MKISIKYFSLNWSWVLVTLVVFSALIKLAYWQYSRAQEKTARLVHIAKVQNGDNFLLSQVVNLQQQESKFANDLPVSFTAELSDGVILLDNQMQQGQFGYLVYQLANVVTDNAQPQAVLVNLGWIAGDRTRQIAPQVTAITGTHKINGHVRILEKGIVLNEDHLQVFSSPLLVQEIDLNKISALLNKTLLPFVVYVSAEESLGYIKNWQPIVMLPEKHLAYAFQWASLALAWLLLMLWAAVKANNKNNKEVS